MTTIRLLPVVATLLLFAGCAPLPPVAAARSCDHAPLDYSPILVKVNISANYQMRTPEAFHDDAPARFFAALASTNHGKYELADGDLPNLILNITITNDGHDHYGAFLAAYGNGEGYLFRYSWAQNYVTGSRLLSDIASMVNRFITEGWHTNPC